MTSAGALTLGDDDDSRRIICIDARPETTPAGDLTVYFNITDLTTVMTPATNDNAAGGVRPALTGSNWARPFSNNRSSRLAHGPVIAYTFAIFI